MPFPESPRVFYGRNPLEEVVCQVRFPPILRIDAETPAVFQDRIRTTFPLYRRVVMAPPIVVPGGLPQQVLQMLPGGGTSTHQFLTADQTWTVSLTREFLTVSAAKYENWEGFKSHLSEPLAALRATYAPAFFQRVGLRYRDKIDRKALGIPDAPWSDLLQPHILGELGDPNIGPSVVHALREVIINLSDAQGQVRIVHGLTDDAVTYLIDADFYTQAETVAGDETNVLDAFNRRAGRLFRWCITPRLHEAMGPQSGKG